MLALIRRFRAAVLCSAVALLAGCAGHVSPLPQSAAGSALWTGSVHGGQQPVAGATIQLYAVGTAGDGSAATPLLSKTVATDAGGNFSITGDFTCGISTEVYLTATGGNPGLGGSGNNPNLALMAALGPCSSLTASTFIYVNELTTVAATASLYPYSSSISAIGSGSADAGALANAFSLSAAFVDPSTGATPGVGVPAGMSVPSAELNTLADVLAACINSGGGATGDNSACGTLFQATTVGGVAPSDTITAMLNVAKYPSSNPAQLYALAPAAGPFQPVLTSAPASFAVQLQAMAASSALTVNPASIVFVQTAVGFASQPETVTLTNTGSTAVTISSIALSGANSSDFAETNTCGTSIAASASCTVSVLFTPGAASSRTGTLTITSSASGSPQSVSLSGTGGAASAGPVSLSVSSLNWTTADLWQDFQVQNYGNTPLTIRGITSNSTAFVVVANGCGTQLAARTICTVSVQSVGFSITSGNTQYVPYGGTITVDDDASAGAQTLAVNSDNQTAGSATANFGTWAVGSTTAGSVGDSSGSYYFPSTLSASVSGTNAADFVLASSYCSILNGSFVGCSVVLNFVPTGIGVRTARININGSGYLPVAGKGQAPGPSFTTTYKNSTFFQGEAVTNAYGVATATDTYTILNNGTTTLNLNFGVTGANASNYLASGSCMALAPKASCTVAVAFTSQTVGTFSANVVIADSSSSYVQTLPVMTVASYPVVGTTGGELNFYNQPLGTTSAPQSVTVDNGNIGGNLGDPVTISASQSGQFTTDINSCPGGPTVSCVFKVYYTPVLNGINNDYFVLTDTKTGKTGKAYVYGNYVNSAVSLSTRSVIFPARTLGTTSVPTNVTLTNTGTTSLTVSAVKVTGAVNGNFTVSTTCSSVAVNGTCTIGVTFAPTTSGTQTATVQITSNAATSPDTISVSGSTQ